jgi:acetyltransferase-like isoleucine patch superfamily enzyme
MIVAKVQSKYKSFWTRFWMRYAGLSPFGRISTRLATCFVPPYKSRCYLARLNAKGYIAPSAIINHNAILFCGNIFIGDRVVIYKGDDGGPIKLGKGTHIHNDTYIETGMGGSLTIGEHTHIQPRCHFSAYKAATYIGSGVQIAPNCACYPYHHGINPGEPITQQPLLTKGGIFIDDDAWLGFGVIVLDGVRIGKGAVIGAGSVVTRDVPDGAVAVGVPARVIKMRSDVSQNANNESKHSGIVS